MYLNHLPSDKKVEAIIEKLVERDYQWLLDSRSFSFDWTTERDNEVYKIRLMDAKDNILGVISLIDYPEEYRVYLNLLEVGKPNRGKHKQIDSIAGCLIAFAASIAIKRGYFGFVSLEPKTALIELYRRKYGFTPYGRYLALENEAAKELIENI